MESLQEQKEFIDKLMTMLENQLGPTSEIVLHDYSMPYEHSIVDIRNGNVTGRKVGDCVSNFGLEVLSGTVTEGDRYNYITYLPSRNIVRSSSMYFTNSENKVIGCLCINTDITDTIRFEDYLHKLNNYTVASVNNYKESEIFPGNVQDLLEHLISESQAAVGKPIESMTKDDKMQFLKHLDEKGAFLISKSGEQVCTYLGISKFTMYKYLDIVRGTDSIE